MGATVSKEQQWVPLEVSRQASLTCHTRGIRYGAGMIRWLISLYGGSQAGYLYNRCSHRRYSCGHTLPGRLGYWGPAWEVSPVSRRYGIRSWAFCFSLSHRYVIISEKVILSRLAKSNRKSKSIPGILECTPKHGWYWAPTMRWTMHGAEPRL